MAAMQPCISIRGNQKTAGCLFFSLSGNAHLQVLPGREASDACNSPAYFSLTLLLMLKYYALMKNFPDTLRQSPDLRSDLHDVLTALARFFILSLGIALLFLIFLWDASTGTPFTETAPTEIAQSCMLAACIVFCLKQARAQAELRPAFCLFAAFLGCMLIREQDYFLDMIVHGFWKWPAILLALGAIARAASSPWATVHSLAVFSRRRGFTCILAGLATVLVSSRIYGVSALWKSLLPSDNWRATKYAAEESSELFGYFLILYALLAFYRKK